jgi:hypothetical protein
MPQFIPGQAKMAGLLIPVSPSGLNCTAELFLTKDGTVKASTSGPIAFTSTGVAQTIQLPISMPAVEDTYLVRITISSAESQLGAYQAIDSVVIAAPVESVNLLVQKPTVLQTFWGITIYDLSQQKIIQGGGATGDTVPTNFTIKSKDFLMVPSYLPSYPVGYPMEYGPFQVLCPSWGNYQYNIVTPTVAPIGAVMTNVGSSRSRVVMNGSATGGYTAPGINYPSQFMGGGTILNSTPISGINIGSYLIGIPLTWMWFIMSMETAVLLFNNPAARIFSADLYSGFWDYGMPGQARKQYFGLSNITA